MDGWICGVYVERELRVIMNFVCLGGCEWVICVFARLAVVLYQEVPIMPQAHLSFPVISFQVVNKTSSTKPLVGINDNL
jgi:hypothetical protein